MVSTTAGRAAPSLRHTTTIPRPSGGSRMAVTRSALVGMLISVVLASPMAAQTGTGIISGHVVDSASKQPLAAVSIRVAGTTTGVLSQGDGSYVLRGVQPGTVQLRATRIGFAAQSSPVTVAAGRTSTVDFALSARAAVLS